MFRYIILFIILIVIISVFNIDVRSVVESPGVQQVFEYIKVVIQFIINAIEDVAGQFQSSDELPEIIEETATTTS